MMLKEEIIKQLRFFVEQDKEFITPNESVFNHAADLIESQAAEIESLKSGLRESIAHITKMQLLCDQLGRALVGHCAPLLGHEEEQWLALEAWRAMK